MKSEIVAQFTQELNDARDAIKLLYAGEIATFRAGNMEEYNRYQTEIAEVRVYIENTLKILAII